MKIFLLCIPVLLILNSCSTDSDVDQAVASKNYDSASTSQSVLPENLANKMDLTGKLYFEQLHQYSQRNQLPKSVGELSEEISIISKSIGNISLSDNSVIHFTDEIIESILLDPDNIMIAMVTNSTLSQNVKDSLINFLQTLNNQRALDFKFNYDFIVDYENEIIADSTIVEDEKDTLLTVTSISRYSLYSEVKRRDRDWETSVGSKIKSKTRFSNGEMAIVLIIALLPQII